jgi:hypothetical protein
MILNIETPELDTRCMYMWDTTKITTPIVKMPIIEFYFAETTRHNSTIVGVTAARPRA